MNSLIPFQKEYQHADALVQLLLSRGLAIDNPGKAERSLGRDIVELQIEQKWGEKVISRLAQDLREALPNVSGLTKRNIYYCKQFYALYAPVTKMLPQAGAINEAKTLPQVGATFESDIFCVPWGHHKVLIDKCFGYPEKAMFYIHEIVSNGWSRSMLLNFISTELY